MRASALRCVCALRTSVVLLSSSPARTTIAPTAAKCCRTAADQPQPCALGMSRAALTCQRAFYASNNSNDKDAAAPFDASATEKPDTDSASTHAIDFTHAPSLRDALPPSAVELPEQSFLKCIDKEIMDEKYRLDKEEGPPPVPIGWTMHHTDGTSFIYGRRVWMPPPPSSSSASTAGSSSAASSDNASSAEQGGASAAGGENEGASAQQQQQPVKPVPRAMEKHFLRIQLTARDASLDPECDVRGEHFPFSFFVQRVRPEEAEEAEGGNGGAGGHIDLSSDAFEEHTFYHDSIEVRCDVVEGELVVDNVVLHGSPTTAPPSTATASTANPFGGYPGPNLDEAEEEVLDGIQSWLAERGVDDQLGEFVGQYAIWIEQAEYEQWLQQLRDYVAA